MIEGKPGVLFHVHFDAGFQGSISDQFPFQLLNKYLGNRVALAVTGTVLNEVSLAGTVFLGVGDETENAIQFMVARDDQQELSCLLALVVFLDRKSVV